MSTSFFVDVLPLFPSGLRPVLLLRCRSFLFPSPPPFFHPTQEGLGEAQVVRRALRVVLMLRAVRGPESCPATPGPPCPARRATRGPHGTLASEAASRSALNTKPGTHPHPGPGPDLRPPPAPARGRGGGSEGRPDARGLAEKSQTRPPTAQREPRAKETGGGGGPGRRGRRRCR